MSARFGMGIPSQCLSCTDYTTLGKALGLGTLPPLSYRNIITYSNAAVVIDLGNIKLF